MRSKTILVVDDEAVVRVALRTLFEAEGWQVFEAVDETTMIEIAGAGGIDLVTLDLGLGPGSNPERGLQIARDLRTIVNVPVVIISGSDAPYDRARGLEAGADDYIVKPFDNREVMIRVRRILDRYGAGPSPSEVTFDHTFVDLTRSTVRHQDGREETLTDMERRLLELFLAHPAQVLSRDQITQALHGRDWSPLDRTIDGHVARLRRKISQKPNAPQVIRSVRGVGYVFAADLPDTET